VGAEAARAPAPAVSLKARGWGVGAGVGEHAGGDDVADGSSKRSNEQKKIVREQKKQNVVNKADRAPCAVRRAGESAARERDRKSGEAKQNETRKVEKRK